MNQPNLVELPEAVSGKTNSHDTSGPFTPEQTTLPAPLYEKVEEAKQTLARMTAQQTKVLAELREKQRTLEQLEREIIAARGFLVGVYAAYPEEPRTAGIMGE